MKNKKIGAMTCCWNEEATIAFTVGSLLPHVDYYVVADTGSTDKTVELLETIFSKEIESGKLIILKEDKREDWDISIPKNKIIDKFKELGVDYFIRLDGDDVFYDSGAKFAVYYAKLLDDKTTIACINHWELYQNRCYDTESWLQMLNRDLNKEAYDRPRFWCMRMPPGANPTRSGFPHRFDGSYGHARIYRVEGAVSVGKWTDEAWRAGPGEDIHHPHSPRVSEGSHDECIVHYGWARPMKKKLEKGAIWSGEMKASEDPRVGRMEKVWNKIDKENIDRHDYGKEHWPNYIIFPFTKHPEVFQRLIKDVIKIIE